MVSTTEALRVLLADDDDEMRALAASALRSDGCDVVEVTNGVQLLDAMAALLIGEASVLPVELIVSDVRMPGITGLSVLAGLHAAGIDVPVILITAFADDDTRAEARRFGAFALLDKPFEMGVLRSLVRRSAARLRGEAKATARARPGAGRRLLLAEDDPDMRWLLAYALRKEGYDVLEASDGAELRSLARSLGDPREPAPLAAIISDQRMPCASGLDVLAEMRARAQPTPFILITGFGDEGTHAQARSLGAAVFDKPLDFDAFGAAVRTLAGR